MAKIELIAGNKSTNSTLRHGEDIDDALNRAAKKMKFCCAKMKESYWTSRDVRVMEGMILDKENRGMSAQAYVRYV